MLVIHYSLYPHQRAFHPDGWWQQKSPALRPTRRTALRARCFLARERSHCRSSRENHGWAPHLSSTPFPFSFYLFSALYCCSSSQIMPASPPKKVTWLNHRRGRFPRILIQNWVGGGPRNRHLTGLLPLCLPPTPNYSYLEGLSGIR